MPTFDFRCAKCSTVFEFSRPFGSKTMPACPACGSKKTDKLLTPPPVHFKGAGWYKTDSRAASAPKKEAPAKAKPDTADSTAPAATPDAKPASDAKPTTPASEAKKPPQKAKN